MTKQISETWNNWKAFLTGIGFGVFGIVVLPYLIYKAVKDFTDTGFFL
ncbi:hypothetical protein ACFOQM_03525 [Paenibacillus sp. GCM10012307]|uniref:Uncharacterized protein n=1 Tax=Paenibacillus roseus TaxID=2798579 RepID=A0A934MPG1_9BACL|nr:hypothetical protein [Paenibacillus roseus]MBJ6360384.1 hypothetical protein [Paenibacillus roseus]